MSGSTTTNGCTAPLATARRWCTLWSVYLRPRSTTSPETLHDLQISHQLWERFRLSGNHLGQHQCPCSRLRRGRRLWDQGMLLRRGSVGYRRHSGGSGRSGIGKRLIVSAVRGAGRHRGSRGCCQRVVREEAVAGGVGLRNTRHVLSVGSGTESRPYGVLGDGGQDARPTSPGADWAKDARAL